MQVSCLTCGFWPVVEGLFTVAAFFVFLSSFLCPMLSGLSAQRNHCARVTQGRVTEPPHPFGEEEAQKSTGLFVLALAAGVFVRGCFVCVNPVVRTPSRCLVGGRVSPFMLSPPHIPSTSVVAMGFVLSEHTRWVLQN